MSKRKDNKKNYKYPKENEVDDTSKIDKEKKLAQKKKTKKKEKNIECKSYYALIEETKDIDNDHKNKNNQQDNKLKVEKDNTKESTNKQNINTNQFENENIEGDLLNYYIEEIKKTIEEDKNDKFIISTETEEKNIDDLNNKKKSKKDHSIDVTDLQEIKLEYDNKTYIPIEVKNNIFKDIDNVYKEITYDGKIFIQERHKTKEYPKIITYRCKNQRKNERLIHSYFCNATVKRKIDKDKCFYILEKEHSEECCNLITKKKDAPKIINDYNDYITKCFTFLDSTENYNKSEFTMKLQNIYNENNYKFALKENTIKNIIGRWKHNSLKFTKYNALEHRYNKNNELILWDYVNTVIYSSNKKK